VVLITTRTSESFIVVRWSDGTAPQDFTVWGGTIYLSMNAVAGQFTDIRDEVESNDTDITTLQTSKLDIAWGLRTWLTDNTLMTTNGSGAETQLAFSWVDTEVLYGDGTRSVPSVTIPNATETAAWLMPERATDAETLAGTADKFPDASQIKDKYTPKSVVLTSAITFDDVAISNIVLSHWLWKIPHSISVIWYTGSSISNIYVWSAWYDGTTITQRNAFGTSWLLYYDGDWIDRWTRVVTAIDATNVTLSYTPGGSFGWFAWNFYILINS